MFFTDRFLKYPCLIRRDDAIPWHKFPTEYSVLSSCVDLGHPEQRAEPTVRRPTASLAAAPPRGSPRRSPSAAGGRGTRSAGRGGVAGQRWWTAAHPRSSQRSLLPSAPGSPQPQCSKRRRDLSPRRMASENSGCFKKRLGWLRVLAEALRQGFDMLTNSDLMN